MQARTNSSPKFNVTLDLDGEKVNVQLPWGRPLPPIIYNSKTGIFYQLLKGYSYCQVDGQILSNIEVSHHEAN